LASVFSEKAQLRVGERHMATVTMFLADGEGLAIPDICLIQPPTSLGGNTELVVVARYLRAVTKFLRDSQGLAIPDIRLIEPATVMGGNT
jgi:hypothetical protein